MVSEADGVDVLISIHPRHASKILSGDKRAEFRRRPPKREASYLIVYATAPIKMVVGFARITGVVEGTLEALWTQFGSLGGISRSEFDDYFTGTEEGSVILIDDAKRLTEPVEANRLTQGGSVPQSFRYVSGDFISRVAGAS